MKISTEDFWHMSASKFKIYMYFRFEDNDFDLRSESYIKTLSKILRIPPDLIVKGVKELLDEGYISNGFLEVKINSLDLV